MDIELQRLCEQLSNNRNVLDKTFPWDSRTMALAGSAVLMGLRKSADVETLKRCEKILDSHTSVVSEFRGSLKLPLICKMSASDDPDKCFLNVQAVDKLLNGSKWFGNTYMLLASMTLCDHIDVKDAQTYVDKTNEIYHRMKESHKLITSDEDIPFAAVLAASGIDADILICESERCYPVLKDKFGIGSGNAVQTLCHILALSQKDSGEKCAKVERLYDRLKEEKHKMDVSQELASLGMLATLDADTEELINEIIEADVYLKKQKGFSDWDIGGSMRRMYASMVVMEFNSRNGADNDNSKVARMLATSVAVEVYTTIMLSLFMFS